MAATRPVWLWLGQLGLIVLGTHLAADRLDDAVHAWLGTLPIPWTSPDQPLAIAAWGSVLLEILVVLRAATALLLTSHEPALSLAGWKRCWSVDAVVLPLFWAPVALAGAWGVGMAVEDALAPWHPQVALALGASAAAVAAWRLGWTGWKRVTGAIEPPKRRSQGWPWAVPLLLVALTAVLHGLPIWGWR